jgi:hypothetical protein
MLPGDTFRRRGQRYDCVGVTNHETRDRRWVNLLVLESKCADCGRGFFMKATQTNVTRRELTRRCERCRRPGKPVVIAKPAANVGKRRRAPAPRAIPHTPVQGVPFQRAQKPACEPAMVERPRQASSALSAACRAEGEEREAHERQVDAYLNSLGLLG